MSNLDEVDKSTIQNILNWIVIDLKVLVGWENIPFLLHNSNKSIVEKLISAIGYVVWKHNHDSYCFWREKNNETLPILFQQNKSYFILSIFIYKNKTI